MNDLSETKNNKETVQSNNGKNVVALHIIQISEFNENRHIAKQKALVIRNNSY